MSFSSRKTKNSPSNSAPAIGLASHSQSVNPWSAHAPPLGHSPSPFPRFGHALSTTATATGELFLFGGSTDSSAHNDLHVFSTRDFSTTLLQTTGESPSPRDGHGTALTSTLLFIWCGRTNFSGKSQDFDDSLYLLNFGMSDLFMSRPAPADQSFLPSSISSVDSRRGQCSQALRSLLPYRGFGWFQSLRLRWPDRWKAIQ